MKEYNITGNLCKATVGFIAANKRRNKVIVSSSYQPCVEERVNIYIFANYNFMQHFLPEVKVHKNNRILVGVIADDPLVAHNRCNVDKSQANLSATL